MLNFTVEVRDANRVRVGQLRLEDITVTYTDRYDNVGEWQVTLVPQHPLAPALRAPGAGIIITDIASGETLMSGPVVGIKSTASADDPDGTLTISGASDDVIASDRLAYADPTHADASAATTVEDARTGPAETLMHQYVDANVGPSAPTGRRIDYLTLGPDAGRGTVQTRRANYQVLGTLLGDIAAPDGLGFRFRQVGTSIEFQTYAVQDRSATVRLDIRNNTLSSHTTERGPASATRVIVAGKAADDTKPRPTVEVTTDDSLASEAAWQRRIEVFKDARSTADTGELLQQGISALADAGLAQLAVKAVPMNDTTMVYGRDWGLGDRIAIVVDGVELPGIVTGVVVKAGADGTMMGALIGDPQTLGNGNTGLSSRISNLERNATAGGGTRILSADLYTESTTADEYPDGESLLYLDPAHTAAGWPTFSGKRMVLRTVYARSGSADVAQTATRLNDTSLVVEQYVRSSMSGVWSAWKKLATADDTTALSTQVTSIDGRVTAAEGQLVTNNSRLIVVENATAHGNLQGSLNPTAQWYRVASMTGTASTSGQVAAEFTLSTNASDQKSFLRFSVAYAYSDRKASSIELIECGGLGTAPPWSRMRLVPIGGTYDGVYVDVLVGTGAVQMDWALEVRHHGWQGDGGARFQLEPLTPQGNPTDGNEPWMMRGIYWTSRWTALARLGTWANYGDVYPFAEFRMLPGSVVKFRGLVKNTAGTNPSANDPIGTLPGGCRPAYRHVFPAMSGGDNLGRVDVAPNGGVLFMKGTVITTNFMALDTIHFVAEQ